MAENVKELTKAKHKNLTIPVRAHDLEMMRKSIGTGCYEFHLSYEEILSGDIEAMINTRKGQQCRPKQQQEQKISEADPMSSKHVLSFLSLNATEAIPAWLPTKVSY